MPDHPPYGCSALTSSHGVTGLGFRANSTLPAKTLNPKPEALSPKFRVNRSAPPRPEALSPKFRADDNRHARSLLLLCIPEARCPQERSPGGLEFRD